MQRDADPVGYWMTRPDEMHEQERLGQYTAIRDTRNLYWLTKQSSDLQHQVWLITCGGRLHTLTTNAVSSGRILDLGCGTAAWAIAISKQFPETEVLAVDLTPPRVDDPSCPKLIVQKHDIESPWAFPQKFNFIHGRMLASGIHDWPALLTRCWNFLVPGGWLELLDLCHPFHAEVEAVDNSSCSDFIKWGHVAERCWSFNGLDYRATNKHVRRLQELGFVNVEEEELKWPLGEWPEAEREKRIGKLTLSNFSTFLATAGVGIICQDPSINTEEAQALVNNAQRDLMDHGDIKRFYLSIKIHRAQKPS